VEFDATGQLLILYFAIVDYLKIWEYNEAVHHTYIDYKKAYNSAREKVLCNVLIEFGMPTNVLIMIKIYLNKTWNRVRLEIHLSVMFCIKNSLKPRNVLLLWLFSVAVEYAIKKVQASEETLNLNGTAYFLVYADRC
jgi:hypothetical protein